MQYQYANFSANYLYWGKGTIQFQLINQRSDFSFALFTGGLENVRSQLFYLYYDLNCQFYVNERRAFNFCSRSWWG